MGGPDRYNAQEMELVELIRKRLDDCKYLQTFGLLSADDNRTFREKEQLRKAQEEVTHHEFINDCANAQLQAVQKRLNERKEYEKCANCGQWRGGMKNCIGCKHVKKIWYCDTKCQKAHWKVHKPVCHAAAPPRPPAPPQLPGHDGDGA